jgi:hypothetical protein
MPPRRLVKQGDPDRKGIFLMAGVALLKKSPSIAFANVRHASFWGPRYAFIVTLALRVHVSEDRKGFLIHDLVGYHFETELHPVEICSLATVAMASYIPKYDQPCTVEELEQLDAATLTAGERNCRSPAYESNPTTDALCCCQRSPDWKTR